MKLIWDAVTLKTLPGTVQGDAYQQGGTFVIGPGNKVKVFW